MEFSHPGPIPFIFLNEISFRIEKNKRARSIWDRPVLNPSVIILISEYC